MRMTNRRALVLMLPAAGFFASAAWAHDDRDHIVKLMKGMFDTPDNPLMVAPVVVRGDNAIASWSQGGKGGRALLWRKHGAWQVRLCSGASLKEAKMLEGAGLSAEDAAALTSELKAEEAKLDAKMVASFDLFEGTIDMSNGDAATGHGAHKHGNQDSPQTQ